MERELYYQDLNLLPTQDVSLNFLMSKVMSVIHLVCVESERAFGVVNIGIGFPKYDKETLYAIRRLSKWTGDVYVREPSGTGYWANVNVNYNINYDSLIIPITISVTRVEGGI